MYADIIVDISNENLDKTYQYSVPEHLRGRAVIGAPVLIQFGRGSRVISGYIVGLSDKAKIAPERIKPIDDIPERSLEIEERLVGLAVWIKEQFGSTMNEALKCVIPVRKKVREILNRTIVSAVSCEELRRNYELAVRKKHRAKERLLYELLELSELDYGLATEKLNISASTIKKLEVDGIIAVKSTAKYRNPIKQTAQQAVNIELNSEQRFIADEIKSDIDRGIRRDYLIHGVTGSGKTEVYMDIIEKVISMNRQVIMLIPEIALTYQTVKRFYLRFGDRISIMNSRLSAGERYDQYLRAKRGETDIVIGPRSALFTPFERLGLIIIDEEHENSYKSESAPKYHAREVALKRAGLENASVILGSATPSLEAYSRAEDGRIKLYTLKQRAANAGKPKVTVVDMREELKNKNRSVFSLQLKAMIAERLEKKEQMMLFLNRRGYTGFISCRSCGKVIKCRHCDVSMTLHKGNIMMCHYCGEKAAAADKCPECGSRYIGSFGIGTQKVEELIKKEFPSARVLRMDADTTRGKTGHEEILSAFANGEADILVGTQMIVKGHDFHNVTLVGILLADLSLYSSDFRSAERTYQLLAQAAGRAGRGAKNGEVVIQTYNTEHYAVKKAALDDYEGFYAEEMTYRRLMKYPPSQSMLLITVLSADELTAGEMSDKIVCLLKMKKHESEDIKIIGPAPAAVARINDVYRFCVFVKGGDYSRLVELKNMINDYATGTGKQNFSVQYDFNPG